MFSSRHPWLMMLDPFCPWHLWIFTAFHSFPVACCLDFFFSSGIFSPDFLFCWCHLLSIRFVLVIFESWQPCWLTALAPEAWHTLLSWHTASPTLTSLISCWKIARTSSTLCEKTWGFVCPSSPASPGRSNPTAIYNHCLANHNDPARTLPLVFTSLLSSLSNSLLYSLHFFTLSTSLISPLRENPYDWV